MIYILTLNNNMEARILDMNNVDSTFSGTKHDRD